MDSSPTALARRLRGRVTGTGDESADLLLELDLSRGVTEAPPSSPV